MEKAAGSTPAHPRTISPTRQDRAFTPGAFDPTDLSIFLPICSDGHHLLRHARAGALPKGEGVRGLRRQFVGP